MAQHYGFVISPTKPHMARHKGKVESGVYYLQRNFMVGQVFADILVANRHLGVWVRETAGTREHGTTHQPPLQLFLKHEQAALLPLASQPFSLCEVRPVKVHPDRHVVIAGSFYSVPYRYVGQTLDAYIGERMVQLFAGQPALAAGQGSWWPATSGAWIPVNGILVWSIALPPRPPTWNGHPSAAAPWLPRRCSPPAGYPSPPAQPIRLPS